MRATAPARPSFVLSSPCGQHASTTDTTQPFGIAGRRRNYVAPSEHPLRGRNIQDCRGHTYRTFILDRIVVQSGPVSTRGACSNTLAGIIRPGTCCFASVHARARKTFEIRVANERKLSRIRAAGCRIRGHTDAPTGIPSHCRSGGAVYRACYPFTSSHECPGWLLERTPSLRYARGRGRRLDDEAFLENV